MFRKILIATVASLSFLSPLALPVQSQAHEHHHPHVVHHQYYRVYFRTCPAEAFRFTGSYRYYDQAFRAAEGLRLQGFEAFIR